MIVKFFFNNTLLIKKFIFLNNLNNCKIFKIFIINFKNTNICFFSNFGSRRYQWIFYDFNGNDITSGYIKLSGFFTNNNNYKNIVSNEKLYDIINFKKKCSLIKKKVDIKYIILNKIFYESKNDNFLNKKIKNNNIYNTTNYKNFDFKKKLKLIFRNNRKILKEIYNLKYYRNFSLNKNIKNICNFSKINNLTNINNNILSILLKTDFFFSKKDCLWFLKNSLISVNSLIIKNKNYILRDYDIINIAYTNKYFYYYKNYLNNLLNNFYKIGLKLWAINKKRFKPSEKNDKKFLKENYPNWIENFMFFKKDIPLFLEVDYMTMTVIFLDYNKNFKNFDHLNFKLFNFHLSRLYNWKFII